MTSWPWTAVGVVGCACVSYTSCYVRELDDFKELSGHYHMWQQLCRSSWWNHQQAVAQTQGRLIFKTGISIEHLLAK
eukprot:4784442-Amphidinium_carterae.1